MPITMLQTSFLGMASQENQVIADYPNASSGLVAVAKQNDAGACDNIIPFPGQYVGARSHKNLEVRKTTQAAESLVSYDQIKLLADWLRTHGTFRHRNYAMFITGVATGLRISDLVRLRVKDVIDVCTGEFHAAIDINEIKTGKRTLSMLDDVAITDAVKEALTCYFDSIGWRLNAEEYLFKSRKVNGAGEYRLDESQGYRIITDAAKGAGITDVHVGSHTMRKTFCNIAYALGTVSNLRNSTAVLMDIQILTRHASLETTKRYMNMEKPRLLSLREGVSKFLLGQTRIKDLAVRYEIDLMIDEEE